MPCVSVIIPVFGVERFIESCARSLFEQTLKDMEFIFVNDCTNDHSIEILKKVISEYPLRQNQISIINHDRNKGLPVARRTGIEAAKGDYIIQCDSDDWVDISMYEKLYKFAILNDADVAMCGYMVTDGVTQKPYLNLDSDKKTYISNCLYQRSSGAIWSKLFRKKLFDSPIDYPTEAMAEDIVLVLQLFHYSNKIVCVNEALYYYFTNVNSISKSLNPQKIYQKFIQSYNNTIIIENFFKRHSIYAIYKQPLMCFKHNQRNLLSPLLEDSNYYSLWRSSFMGINYRVFFMPISIKDKIIFLLRYLKIIRK